MPNGPSANRRCEALDALREVILAGEKFRLVVSEYFGITVSESLAISYLAARGDLGQTELANHLGLTTSSTTSLVDRLEGNRYVERMAHPDDRRRTIVHLTERGSGALAQSRDWLRSALDRVPDADLPDAAALLQTLAADLRRGAHEIPVRHEA